jgi:hypothetical protein
MVTVIFGYRIVPEVGVAVYGVNTKYHAILSPIFCVPKPGAKLGGQLQAPGSGCRPGGRVSGTLARLPPGAQ